LSVSRKKLHFKNSFLLWIGKNYILGVALFYCHFEAIQKFNFKINILKVGNLFLPLTILCASFSLQSCWQTYYEPPKIHNYKSILKPQLIPNKNTNTYTCTYIHISKLGLIVVIRRLSIIQDYQFLRLTTLNRGTLIQRR